MLRLRSRYLVAVAIALFVVFRLWAYPSPDPWLPGPGQQHDHPQHSQPNGQPTAQQPSVLPVNSTLGFGRIYVVSKEDSPRRHSLLQAANVTELDFTIPIQPNWTESDLEGHTKIGRGSLLAWLGHLHSLREFLDSGAETALILEDDVDWDIRLRSLQAPLVASAVRTLLASTTPVSSLPSTPSTADFSTDVVADPAIDADADADANATRYPYGDPAAWDLLYLGHCGDYWHPIDVGFKDGHVRPSDLAARPHISFNDASLPDPKNLHPWTASLLENLGVAPHTRLVHKSVFPLCTFAYAVTRTSARRLLKELSLDGRGEDEPMAYDVAILISCRDSDDMRCYSVNPELFHHLPGKSMISGIDNHTNIPPVDDTGREQAELRHETPNINCGFWNGAFTFQNGDSRRLARLREEVGRKGRCLKSGRDLP